jgi:inositol phosphorylceramide synthase regulatory subunit
MQLSLNLQEDPKNTLYFAHIFAADHILSTAWTVFFAVVWWVYTPHDGRQEIASEAQKQIMEAGGGGHTNMTAAERAQAATELWNSEKGTAAAVITLGWLSKVCRPCSRAPSAVP